MSGGPGTRVGTGIGSGRFRQDKSGSRSLALLADPPTAAARLGISAGGWVGRGVDRWGDCGGRHGYRRRLGRHRVTQTERRAARGSGQGRRCGGLVSRSQGCACSDVEME